ncbi:hypothetical protein B0T26DRAFT_324728 [Lasiosphaeria miniovina]|uniref:Uncharacterized protein n=1 Tax=Lasiosphaeria miniovina TaxID=1954250 RepID=A0AA40AM04_9PEZI|nr:uncharacterized protein B0T26DRAFT_324728 [Lasiosphaeria miniovina]KAK0718289.1 hypothetical protein B0T26DRAFT_324728 [Lasiosphaeria miniovina]
MRRKSETHRLTTLFTAMLCLISCYGEVSINGHSDFGRITCPTLTLAFWAGFAASPLWFAVGCPHPFAECEDSGDSGSPQYFRQALGQPCLKFRDELTCEFPAYLSRGAVVRQWTLAPLRDWARQGGDCRTRTIRPWRSVGCWKKIWIRFDFNSPIEKQNRTIPFTQLNRQYDKGTFLKNLPIAPHYRQSRPTGHRF